MTLPPSDHNPSPAAENPPAERLFRTGTTPIGPHPWTRETAATLLWAARSVVSSNILTLRRAADPSLKPL